MKEHLPVVRGPSFVAPTIRSALLPGFVEVFYQSACESGLFASGGVNGPRECMSLAALTIRGCHSRVPHFIRKPRCSRGSLWFSPRILPPGWQCRSRRSGSGQQQEQE